MVVKAALFSCQQAVCVSYSTRSPLREKDLSLASFLPHHTPARGHNSQPATDTPAWRTAWQASFSAFRPATYNTCTTIRLDQTWIYIGLTPVWAVTQWKVISLFEIGRARRTGTGRGWQQDERELMDNSASAINNARKQIFIKNKTTN